jgi:5-dehydro-4-deoxyglucarate dehydratase
MSVQDLSGVLFFPVTPFTAAGPVDTGSLAEHLRRGLAAGPGGVFAACGTGEFHALDAGEYGHVVHTAVEVTGGAVPVLAGAGGPLPMARQFARVAQEAGFKDGLGDIDLLSRIVVTVRRALDGEGRRFQFFNGMPTAEVSVPAYRALGVELYSSAVFCFAPEVSLAFYGAVVKQESMLIDRFLGEFFHPFVRLRNQVPGYAVSLIKAGVRLRGLDAGGARSRLVDPTPAHLAELARIIDAGLAVAGEATVR